MRIQLYSLALAVIASSAALAADVTTKTTVVQPDGSTQTTVQTTTSTGTITEYVPGTTFVMKEVSGPVIYTYGKTVAYVTKSGKVISEASLKERIRVGYPASVHYVLDGNNRVISQVVVDD